MPLSIPAGNPTLLIRKEAFERAALSRAAFDDRLGLTADEFRVEKGVVVIGPILDEEALAGVFEELEGMGLEHYRDFFDLGGNWPEWLELWVSG